LGVALIAGHNHKKALRQFCEGHPGEPYQFTLPNGTVTSTGTCDGTVSAERARALLIESVKADSAKQGVLKYLEIKDDTYILHSERASLLRFHSMTTDQPFVQNLKRANFKTVVYTNDKDQTFTYDLVSGKETTTETAAQK